MKKTKQLRRHASDGRPLRQVAALPYRFGAEGDFQVLLMSSRETQRAVLPKGWPMKNRKDWKSAEIEAREEAGVVGDISRKRLGQYSYWKRLETHFVLVNVSVYPLPVRRQLHEWPERHERIHIWLAPEDAALLVDEPDLGVLINDFASSPVWQKAAQAALPRRGKRRPAAAAFDVPVADDPA